MKFICITLLFIIPLQMVLAQKSSSKTTTRKINSTTLRKGDIIYRDKLNHLMKELKKLPRLCKGSASLSKKTKKFQKKLNEIKIKALELRLLKDEYKIFFLHPLDEVFALSAFVTYVYEDRFSYDFEIPPREKDLREHLKYLSEDFQLLYRANFQDSSAQIKDFPFWAKHIALSLKCLSEK